MRAVDLSEEFGPTRNQGDIGWCYSYGASDLFGHWLYKNKIGPDPRERKAMVSAAASSYEYNAANRNRAMGMHDARKRLLKIGSQMTNPDRAEELRERDIADAEKRHAEAENELRRLGEDLSNLNPRAKELADRIADLDGTLNAAKLGLIKNMKLNSKSGIAKIDRLQDELDEELGKNKTIQSLRRDEQRLFNELMGLTHPKDSFEKKDLEEPETGWGQEVLNKLLSEGFCREQNVPSDDHVFAQAQTAAPYGHKGLQQLLNMEVHSYTRNPNEETLCKAADAARILFPGLDLDAIKEILRRAAGRDPIMALIEKACVKEKLPAQPRPKAKLLPEEPQHGLEKIKRRLATGHPVGIVYHPEVFSFGGALFNKNVKRDASHFSVIVGQRFNCEAGEPEYIIRNSWGEGACDFYHPQFQRHSADHPQVVANKKQLEACLIKCSPMKPKDSSEPSQDPVCVDKCNSTHNARTVAFQKPPFHCENGNFVILESQLRKGYLGGTYLE